MKKRKNDNHSAGCRMEGRGSDKGGAPKAGRRRAERAAVGLAALLLAAGALGCGKAAAPRLSASTENLTKEYQKTVTDYSKIPVTDVFRQSYADFSLRLLKESRSQIGEKNIMISPLSVMTALEMTRRGAGGETESEMAQALYGDALPDTVRQELLAYMQTLPDRKTAQFHFGNSIWFRTDDAAFTPNENYLETIAGEYAAEIYGAPFDTSTLKDINGWVEQETDGMIQDILKEIPGDAVMYLINAMAFDAEWETPYTSIQIHDTEFFPEEGDAQTVEMMYNREGIYLSDDSATGFLKPYKEGYAFAALLPPEGTAIEDYISEMSGEDFLKLLDNASQEPVDTGLPKFTGETKLSMNEILKALGMELAFDPEKVDFAGMGTYTGGNIYIGNVLHNTYIDVDEVGTRAGAATVVEMDAGGTMETVPSVILNRPFLYAIVDTEANLPIFLGIMENTDGR